MSVQWPRRPVSQDSQDVLPPLRELLLGLNLVEVKVSSVEGDAKSGKGATPFSEQAITAGALGISKVLGTLVAAFGVVGASVTGASGAEQADVGEKIAAFAGASLIVTAMIFGLALIAFADVSARARSAAAAYDARARVARAFLDHAQPIASPRHFVNLGNDQPWVEVSDFRFFDLSGERKLCAVPAAGGPAIDLSTVKGITTADGVVA